jgi:hypothetical protein
MSDNDMSVYHLAGAGVSESVKRLGLGLDNGGTGFFSGKESRFFSSPQR